MHRVSMRGSESALSRLNVAAFRHVAAFEADWIARCLGCRVLLRLRNGAAAAGTR